MKIIKQTLSVKLCTYIIVHSVETYERSYNKENLHSPKSSAQQQTAWLVNRLNI